MSIPDMQVILENAKVPEHSVYFMQTVSGGTACVETVSLENENVSYLYYYAQDWLTFLGYPVQGQYSHESFIQAKNKALEKSKASQVYAIGPDLPPTLQENIQEKDVFYTLDSKAQIPSKLKRPVAKAQSLLKIDEGRDFTSEHRRLWTEFLGRKSSTLINVSTSPDSSSASQSIAMTDMVKQLFLATPTALLDKNSDLRLLNAWDEQGHLVACLLMDFTPKKFCSYMLGAHSRQFYVPHAADALFAFMIELSAKENKEYIHLGLGVNEGITRFKRKWGAKVSMPFVRAAWQDNSASFKDDMHSLLGLVAGRKQNNDISRQELNDFMGRSKRQIYATFAEQRPYAMVWKVQKNDKVSWIGGSAHFFCYSFERSFRKLFKEVDHVIFEGPLDSQSLQIVEKEGKTLTDQQRPLLQYLNEDDIRRLERVVRGPEGFLARALNIEASRKVDVRWFLENARPWSTFFTFWTAFLERNGWQQSVDLEAWNIAHEMGKNVIAMESLEEQLASLNSVPAERVIRFFKNCNQWRKMIKENVKVYLQGDLLKLMGTSAEFPNRVREVIDDREYVCDLF